MSRPTRAVVDLEALRANGELVRQLAPNSKVLAIVKANAYGHGVGPTAETLEHLVDGFGVATLEEAITLRQLGIKLPIVLLEGFFDSKEIPLLSQFGLDTVLAGPHQLEVFLSTPPSTAVRVWLKIDTGMHRLGFPPSQATAIRSRLQACPAVSSVVLMSHFSSADVAGDDTTARQVDLFRQYAPQKGDPVSLANSAAILAWPATHENWVRPGLLLYGLSPLDHPTPQAESLKPVMQLVSQIHAIRHVETGGAIGYGGRFVCDQPTTIGVVPIGYADGYPREAPDGTPVLVNGQRTRLIGCPSMDMITVDLTNLPETQIGDPVELWGANLSATEVAKACGTIPWVLLTSMSPRVPRFYPDD